MRLSNPLLRIGLLVAFLAIAVLVIADKEPASKHNIVEDLTVEDLPADDGTGLLLSWKPLDRSKRIIEYRVYRGVHPDTLFFLQAVQVNVKTGVASDRMYLYDSDGSDFIDISSPGKLRKEKQQDAKSPLYRKIPRDMELAARLSEKFDLFSNVERPALYYKSQKAWSASAEDSTVYAGMQFRDQNIYAYLRAGETYYYSVMAVDERNQYQGYARPVSGTPVPNAPEASPALYSNWLDDKGELTFEWEYPMNKSNIPRYQIHKLPAISDSVWARYLEHPHLLDEIRNPIGSGMVGGGALPNYTSIQLPGLTKEEVENSRFAIEFNNAQGSAFSPLSTARITSSKALPPKPRFRVEDIPNDKGDRVSVIWDNPIAFVTKTTALNSKNTRLKINYQLNKTDTQKVDNLYFHFFIPGEKKPFATINEFYQDFTVILKVPKGYDYRNGFRVGITMKGKDGSYEGYMLEQDLKWDDEMMALMPGKELWRNGVEVSKIQNVVYRRGVRNPTYTLLKKNTSFDSSLDVTISYITRIGRPVYGLNFVKGNTLHTYMNGERFERKLKPNESKKGMVLVSSTIDFVYDHEKEKTLSVNLFRDETLREHKILGTEIKELKGKISALEATADADTLAVAALRETLQAKEDQFQLYKENKTFQDALKHKGQRSWMGFVGSIREPESRRHNYQVLKTDGRGLYSISDPDTTEAGDPNFYFPVANWFARDKSVTLFAVILYGILVATFVFMAKRGRDLYIRPIAGLDEIDNAVGRATEMGRPMLYCMGSGGLADVATLASMSILAQVSKRAAEYDTKMIVPAYDYIVLPVVQEIVRDAHYAVGRPDTYDKNNIFFLTNSQFAYVAGVNGIMVRERMATNFFLGYFSAEALLMTETGNTIGAVQIAGSDATTQIPFFITSCDYTLIGEELYAAGAYLNREPMLMGTLKSQDYLKIIIVFLVLVGSLLSSFQIMTLLNILPTK